MLSLPGSHPLRGVREELSFQTYPSCDYDSEATRETQLWEQQLQLPGGFFFCFKT